MSKPTEALLGQVVLGEYRLDRLVREDEALAVFEAISMVDQGVYTVLVAPEVKIETAATAIEAAVDRASRNVVGVRGVVSLLRGATVTSLSPPVLAVVRRGGVEPEPLPARLSIPDAVRLLTPLAEALAVLHNLGLVHGALCPLTVGRRGDELILDFFGLGAAAEAASGARGARDLLAPAYRPPELRGDRPSSPGPWTDTAALAILALKLISGVRGPLAEDGSLPPLESLGLVVSPLVTDLFSRTLSPTPRLRPLDPRVFLRELLMGASAPVSPPSARVSLPVGEAPASSEQSEVAPTPVIVPETIPSTRASERLPEPPDTEVMQERRQRRLLAMLVSSGLLLLLGGTAAAMLLVLREGKKVDSSSPGPVSTPVVSTATMAPVVPSMPPVRVRGATTYPADEKALIPVPAGAAVWGDRDALVTLVIFGDLTCPLTARALATLPSLATKFGEELRVVFKYYPAPGDLEAARGAMAAAIAWDTGGMEIFWKFVSAVSQTRGKLDEATLERLGVEVGLGAGTISRGLAGATPGIIAQDIELGRRLGVRGTPVLFLNGRRMDGFQPAAKLGKVIEHELRKIRPLLSGGTPPDRLYADRVMSNVTTSEGERLSP
ncbi:MAG: thioredoxin domain-containing protein [Myxococcales bacterium]|nr:thioredoxin domain-containing protein [Polyangiaceae bacterium]MDW8250260.1 thioredoxin domain-containing protein [Myxococcales bacterium]